MCFLWSNINVFRFIVVFEKLLTSWQQQIDSGTIQDIVAAVGDVCWILQWICVGLYICLSSIVLCGKVVVIKTIVKPRDVIFCLRLLFLRSYCQYWLPALKITSRRALTSVRTVGMNQRVTHTHTYTHTHTHTHTPICSLSVHGRPVLWIRWLLPATIANVVQHRSCAFPVYIK
jgi:hypothetical protein